MQSYKKKGQLQLYQELFENPFLDASGEHFKRDASRLLEERDVSLYMEKVMAKIEEELFRARKFLHNSSLPKVTVETDSGSLANALCLTGVATVRNSHGGRALVVPVQRMHEHGAVREEEGPLQHVLLAEERAQRALSVHRHSSGPYQNARTSCKKPLANNSRTSHIFSLFV